MTRFGILVLLAAAGRAAALAPIKPPQVVVERPAVDLGDVGSEEPAVAEFHVRNAGGVALELRAKDLPPDVMLEGLGQPIGPGAARDIRARLDTGRLSGPVDLALTLSTNDPARPELRLSVKALVRAFLLVHPGYARYITVQHAREGTIPQTLGTPAGEAFKVLKVESPNPALRLAFHEATPEERRPEWKGSQWRIESTLASDAPVGPLTGSILIVTDHVRQKHARIPVSGFVRPIFAVTPPEARLGEFDPLSANRARLFVENFAEEPIELEGAETDVEGVRAGLQPLQAGRTWRIVVSVAPERKPGPFAGRIRIRTTSPHQPVIDVPLDGTVVKLKPPSP